MPDSGSSDAPEAASTAAPPKARRRGIGIGGAVVLLIIIAAASLGGWEFTQRMAFVFEEDARVHADLITVSSRVEGWVTDISVREGDRVDKGAVIVKIDERESRLTLDQMMAQMDGVKAEQRRVAAEKNLVDKQTQSRKASESARLDAAKVVVSSLKPQRELTARELKRTKRLFEKKVVSRRQLDQAETQHQRIDREYRIAVAEMKSAEAKVLEAEAERAMLDVLEGDLGMLEQRENEYSAKIAQRHVDLEDRIIKSPVNGVIDKTFVEIGEFVEAGQRLALVHDPENVWIEANIKETEIRRLVNDQVVGITIDAYPDEVFEGRIVNIGSATTAEFALLPTPNPSGNFTKITQRLPVRIAIEQRDGRLRPGMMVEVKIATGQKPAEK